MPSYDLRILVESKHGKQFSYITSSFFNSAVNENLTVSSSDVWYRITGSKSCSYQNTKKFTGDISAGGEIFKSDTLLSSSLSNGIDTGSISFFANAASNRDRLKRFKFFGKKACTVLGVPFNQWIFSNPVVLNSSSIGNFIESNVLAESIVVTNNLSLIGNATIDSNLSFVNDKESDKYIKFVKQSSSITPHNDLLVGYNDRLDQYWISASNHPDGNNDVTFNIGGVNQLDVATINVTNLNTTTETITTRIVLSDGGDIIDDDTDTSISFNESVGNTYSNTGDDTILIRNGRSSPTIIFTPNSIRVNPIHFGIDFIIDGDTNDSLLHVSGTNEKIGILTSTPTKELTVTGDISASGNLYVGDYLSPTGSSKTLKIKADDIDIYGISGAPSIRSGGDINTKITWASDELQFMAGGEQLLTLTEGAQDVVQVGDGGDVDFHVKAGGNYTIYAQGSSEKVGIGTNVPQKTLTVAGDISASGQYYGNQIILTHHAADISHTTEIFIPSPNYFVDGTSNNYLVRWIAPYDGELEKILVNSAATPGSTEIKLYAGTDGTTEKDSQTVNMDTADTTYTFAYESGSTITAGDLVRVGYNASDDSDGVSFTCVWKYRIT